jgi:hypothetical protein
MTEEETREAQGARLRHYRIEAGFRSASEAARRCGWVQPTYITHEAGTRTIGFDDAERYAARLSRPGMRITGQHILYGPSGRKKVDISEHSVTEPGRQVDELEPARAGPLPRSACHSPDHALVHAAGGDLPHPRQQHCKQVSSRRHQAGEASGLPFSTT